MRLMRGAMAFLLVLASLGLISTFVLESGISARALWVQPIERDPRSDTGWRMAGPAVTLLNLPDKSFVTRGAAGVPPQVDAAVIRTTPSIVAADLLLGTLRTARLGALAAILLMIVGLVTIRRWRFYNTEIEP